MSLVWVYSKLWTCDDVSGPYNHGPYSDIFCNVKKRFCYNTIQIKGGHSQIWPHTKKLYVFFDQQTLSRARHTHVVQRKNIFSTCYSNVNMRLLLTHVPANHSLTLVSRPRVPKPQVVFVAQFGTFARRFSLKYSNYSVSLWGAWTLLMNRPEMLIQNVITESSREFIGRSSQKCWRNDSMKMEFCFSCCRNRYELRHLLCRKRAVDHFSKQSGASHGKKT